MDERNGIGGLFDVIVPTLCAAIRAVYKSGVLNHCEVDGRITLPNGHYVDVYALPMVVSNTSWCNTPTAWQPVPRR